MAESIDETHILELTISRLGVRGDGIAEAPHGPVFVAYALPGEVIRAEITGARATLIDILTPSSDRVAPLCRHFTRCGGCATQHLAREVELRWKSDLVRTAFSQQRLDVALKPVVTAEPGTRRRAVFTSRRVGSGAVLGFHAAQDATIVDLAECPVLSPAIATRIPALRALAASLLSRSGEARLTVTVVDTGVDVAVTGGKPSLTADERATIAALARAGGVSQLSLDGETVFSSAPAHLRFGPGVVVPPPGVFLQAVPSAEAAMTALIVAALGKSKRVADLFSGLGTFSLPMAARAEVLAVDSDKAAIAALTTAARHTQGIKKLEAKVRDLMREPLSPTELAAYDAVVFDPPRAGAQAQAERLARSEVATVVAVSCAPGTLARDVRTLVDGGYVLESVTPIDQFLFSAHVEAVAILRRPKLVR